MGRAIWKGDISFGLVNVPIALFPAEERGGDLHFHMLDSRDNARVRYERVNEVTGEEVPWDQVVKAYEYDGGNYVVLSDEDFKRAAVENTQTIAIETFVDRESINHVYFDRPYYLVPERKGEKGYVLLREALGRSKKAGIAKVVIRTRQYLAALLVEGEALVLNLLRFEQELRPASEFSFPREGLNKYGVTEKEIKLGVQLIEAMAGKWEPENYRDDFRDKIMGWIKARAKKGSKAVAPEPEVEEERPGAKVVDMMSLLKESVESRNKSKSTRSSVIRPKSKQTKVAVAAKPKQRKVG